jgi:hypothetical protein
MNTSRLAAPANPCEVAQQRALVSRHSLEIRRRIPTAWNKFILAALMCVFAIIPALEAASIKLKWNPNPETDIAGYLLSYGTSPGNYNGTINTGNVTTVTLNGVEQGRTYYFSLKAVNTAGMQSDASAELSHLVPTTPALPLVPNTAWQLVSASSQETAGEDSRAIFAFDGNPDTFWHSQWSGGAAPPPHSLVLDLGSSQSIQGFRYLPRQDGGTNGHISQFEFLTSADGVTWGSPAASGFFPNDSSEKEVLFPVTSARYIQLRALSDGDGGGYCAVAELKVIQHSITPPPVNRVPVAANQSVTTAEDSARAVTLAATDADGQPLNYRILSQPLKGRLTGTAPNLTYSPNAHANGGDSFTFVANDGAADSNVAVVSITINAINDAPVASSQSLNATAGTPRAITLAASDIDGNQLTFRIIGNPAQGALSGTAPNLTYTPAANASGADSFTFLANDGSADSNTATVSISIASSIALIPSTGWQLVSTSSEETTGEDGRAVNAIDGNPDTFWHSQWSGGGSAAPHEIRIDLGKTESIRGFRYLPRQDDGTNGNIGRYEFHVSSDGINWGSAVASGTFTNNSSEKEVLFTATSGRYILLRSLGDAAGNPYTCVAELKMLQGPAITPPPNVAPVAAAQSVNTTEDQAIAIRLAATDANGDSLSYRIMSQPAMGTLTGNAPNLTYTPHADANGSDSFTFRASDGTADSNTATVSISVNAANDAPSAQSQEVVTIEDKSVGILLVGTDKDGNPLSYNVTVPPTKGKLAGTAPNLTYTPDRDANGSDSFTFVSNDGTTDSTPATVSIAITPANDAPVAAARFVSTDADKPAVIVLSATDKDGDTLTYTIVSQPMKGVLTGTPPRVTYTPLPGAEGSDTLSFRASDGTLNSNTAGVSITLVPVVDPNANAAPEFQFQQIRRATATVGEQYTSASLAGTAIDPDGDRLSYSRSSGPSWLTVAADGSISGTPTIDSEGINKFTVRATDAEGAYSEASLEIEVQSNGLPLPWTRADIGTVDPLSDASGDNSAIRLNSSGVLAGNADSGLLAWQTLSGDGSIIVRIRELENADTATRVGLMIRESLAANSKHTFIGTDGRGYVRWIRRTKTGGGTSTSSVAVTAPLGLWLRLSREGTTVSAFTSANGTDWTRVGRVNVDLGTNCYFGLSTHSGADDKLSAAVFENITATP